MAAMKAVEDYVANLGLDAYLVGGAVRDELLGLQSKDADFLVPGVDILGLHDGARAARACRGSDRRGKTVGVRLFPRDRDLRSVAPAGIEFAPPRREQSTGPGRHDFEIVVDPSATVEDDLARRDFTVNAIARRLGDARLVDPFDGRRRSRAPRSSHRLAAELRRGSAATRARAAVVSQLGLEPDEETLRQMDEEARAVAIVSGERVGGGLAADGMGELSKLLLGRDPRKALRLARDTASWSSSSRVREGCRLRPGVALPRPDVDEHTFAVVQAAADAGMSLRVRLAALFHDLGKPHVAWRGSDRRLHFYARHGRRDHAEVGAQLADGALRRLRYPNELRESVVRIIRFHMLDIGKADEVRARRFSAVTEAGSRSIYSTTRKSI